MSLKSDADSIRQSGWWETAKIIVQALVLAMFVRVFFYQPFNIPSGSMKGTLLVGDYLFVSKLSYGYSRYSFPWGLIPFSDRIFSAEPKRGDVAVFKLPRDNSTDYIKRVIGLPGDTVQMRNGVLYINAKAIPKRRITDFETTSKTGLVLRVPRYEETLPNGVKYNVLDEEPDGQFDNTDVFKVPPGHYFMMGDNRDNSTDSRARWGVGYVPHQNFVGRAEVIFFSADTEEGGTFSAARPWTWPGGIRWGRFFSMVR
ncbi:MAG TPA: signal peptidase I [Hyphomicrobiaceae bacterium]|nr:signal peptidase I [Hyphomicrobiaceae bacterium]